MNKGTYTQPWSRQKNLLTKYKEEEVPDISELINILEGIKFGKSQPKKQTMQAQALFALYYLTGCRATELVKCMKLRKQKLRKKQFISKEGSKKVVYAVDDFGDLIIDREIVEHNYAGIRKKEIKFTRIDGKQCMIIRTENRKHKQRKTKRLPIPLEYERGIAYFVHAYLRYLEPTDILFPFSNQRATQIINQTTGFNIHFIRHIRATHLVIIYDFNEQALIQYMGWTDSRPAKHYVSLKSSDLFREFYKGGRK